MYLIKPQPLNEGDTIEIIAPAGVANYDKILKSKLLIEQSGYNVKLGDYIFEADRYMAASDEKRLADIHNAFLSDEVNAILCARGGYGSIRLLEKLDYNIIKNNPKIFCGYSDITALSLMFLKKSNLITFSSPMAESDFSSDNIDEYTLTSFLNTLRGKYDEYKPKSIINPGVATGIIWGGNLSTISSLCGLDFIPEQKFIFFVEDVNEPVYKIDKLFRQLINIKIFRENISAICFGEFSNVDNSEWLNILQEEIVSELNIPAAAGFKFSHLTQKQTIPIGIQALFDGSIHIE